MHPRPVLALLLLLAVLRAPSAEAWTQGDTLTVAWRPLPNLPAILRPGDTLTVWANAPSTSSGWTAALLLGTAATPLPPAGGGWRAELGWWVLGFRLPAGMPEETYDLALGCSACPPDTTRHSVRVVPAFRSDFCFAQISDTHLPSHLFSSDSRFSVADTSGYLDFGAVVDDLNLVHPEFVLHTGDIVNEGELEEHLSMYEMGRAQALIGRLRAPLFLVSGNHDIGGWDATPPPPGTSRKAWWRTFGWPALAAPPAGAPVHSQLYSFDYGLLHCIGMEGYENSGGYDDYLPALYGASSMTAEQMAWLAADVAAVPAGRTKLAFIHYDFAGQFTDPAALGLDGVVWGHNHGVADGDRAAVPFNLGLRSVIGGRAFRIFRVRDGVVTPGPIHHAGGTAYAPTDSLTVAWSGPNDGTRSTLTATVVNRYGEAWDHARLVFCMVDHDSVYAASGGTIAQALRRDGRVLVYVDRPVGAGATIATTVQATGPAGVPRPALSGPVLAPPRPDPWSGGGDLSFTYTLPEAGAVRLDVLDTAGRIVATLARGTRGAGGHTVTWRGRSDSGRPLGAGLFFVRLSTPHGTRQARFVVLR